MNGIPEAGSTAWRKSSYSDGGDANCVEIAAGCVGAVPVRDSVYPQGGALVVSAASWAPFVAALREGGLNAH